MQKLEKIKCMKFNKLPVIKENVQVAWLFKIRLFSVAKCRLLKIWPKCSFKYRAPSTFKVYSLKKYCKDDAV